MGEPVANRISMIEEELQGICQTQKSLEDHSDLSLRSRFQKKNYFSEDTSLRFFTSSIIRPQT